MASMIDKTIWVVVPVYNAEKWIKKCVRSIQRQTYTNWKAVLVDDGSTDSSGKICDGLAQKDERLLVIHTPNAGAYQARVNGILQVPDNCYCVFCDSDDEFAPNAFQCFIHEAERSDADLVCGVIQRMLKDIPLPRKNDAFFMDPRVFDRKQIMGALYASCFGISTGFPVNLCGKMFRSGKLKKAMQNQDPRPRNFAEDLNVTMHLLPDLDRISIISDTVYRYRFGGGTSRFMPTFLEDSALMYHNKLKYAHLCEADYNVEQLVAIEWKNIIGTYLVMCEKCKTFPHGSLEEEVRYVCGLEETKDAFTRFTDSHSGIAGLAAVIRNGNQSEICGLIREQVKKDQLRDFIKGLVLR